MTICFENYENGHFETYNHCGDSVRHPFLSNVFYCSRDGVFSDYCNMRCGYSISPSDYYPFEQITLFDNF